MLRFAGPVPLAVAGAITIAMSGILVRLADVAPSTAALYRCAYALPLLAVIVLVERRLLPDRTERHARKAVCAGILLALQLIVWHHCIEDVGAGLATVLLNLQIVFVALTAWVVLREPPAGRVLAALPLALAGVTVVSGVFESGAYGDEPLRGALLGVLSGTMYGTFILVFRRTGQEGAVAEPLLMVTIGAAATALVAGFALGELELNPGWPEQGWLLLLALDSQVLSFLLIGASLPRLSPTFGSLLLTLQAVGSVLLAVALLGESPSRWQLAGVAAVMGAVLLATLGERDAGSAGAARAAPGPPEP